MSVTHANKTESAKEPQGVKTMGEAAPQFADNRASTSAQLVKQQLMHNSPRSTAQRATANAMNASPVQQQKIIQRAAPEEQLQMEAIPQMAQLADMEEEEPLQGKFETTQRAEDEELLQGKFETAQRVEDEELLQGKFEPAQRAEKPNNTGLPDNLKSGIENLSGMSMDHVKVHYNSDKPAQLQAHAYAQGSEIHVAPGQEQHVPHEAWHVVQQAQGRVKPTVQMKGEQAINDDAGLEAEADQMGAKALQMAAQEHAPLTTGSVHSGAASVTQRYVANADRSKTSEHGRVKWRGRQDLLAAPELIRTANLQLDASGGQGGMVNLGMGERVDVNGKGLHQVTPQLDREAYSRRAATPRGIGFHAIVDGPNRAGAGRQRTTSEASAQELLTAYLAGSVSLNNFQRALSGLGIVRGQVEVGREGVEPSINPDGRIALPADCRRAAEAITGTQTGFGYDERRVNVGLGNGASERRGASALDVPGKIAQGETSTHKLSMQVYVSSITPFLNEGAGNMLNEQIFNIDRFIELVGEGEHMPLQHLGERPDLAWAAYTALTAEGKRQFAAFAGINEAAAPEVGDSFTTVTEYRMPEYRKRRARGGDGAELHNGAKTEAWTFHWGGVIFKDGEDIVTLENYSVDNEQATNRDWQFDMYGTRTPAQTFHQRHMDSDLHGTVATTLHVQNVNTPNDLRNFAASLADLHRLTGTAGFAARRSEIDAIRVALNLIYGPAVIPAAAAHHRAVYTEAAAQLVAAATLHNQVDAFKAAAVTLQGLVGQAGFAAQKVIVTERFEALPEENNELVTAAVVDCRAASTLQNRLTAFTTAVAALDALPGQDGFAAQKALVEQRYEAIPEASRGLVAAAVATAQDANRRHRDILAQRA